MSTLISKAIVKGWLAGSVETRSIFHGSINFVSGDSVAQLWSDYLGVMYQAARPYMANTWAITSFEIWSGQPSPLVFDQEVAWTWNGTSGSDQVANVVAAVLVGATATKKLMGRKFWSGLAESAVSSNSLVGQALTVFAQMAVDYVAPYTSLMGSVLTPGLIDRNGSFHAFTGGVLSSLLGTMRRRKPGIGL